MSNFTKEQKSAFLSLAEEYDLKVYEIISRGGPTEIAVLTKEEAMLYYPKPVSIFADRKK